MSQRITGEVLPVAVEELARRDVDFARLYKIIGLPPMRARPPGFASLFKIVCGQQVSTASAAAIVGRLEKAASPLTPENFLRLDQSDFKAIGLSRQKSAYGRAIAEAILTGALDLKAVPKMDDEAAIAALSAHKGIGRWTAEVYLLFALRRPDLWPIGDLGVVKGLIRMKGFEERPSPDELLAVAEPWRPWRSVAARMLWYSLRFPATVTNPD